MFEKSEPRVNLNFKVRAEEREILRKYAKKYGVSLSEFIRQSISHFIKTYEEEED